MPNTGERPVFGFLFQKVCSTDLCKNLEYHIFEHYALKSLYGCLTYAITIIHLVYFAVILTNKNSVFLSKWPKHDPEKIKEDTVKIAIQINGKLRGSIEIDKGTDKVDVLKASKDIENVQKYLDEGEIIKEIYIENKIINYVIKK